MSDELDKYNDAAVALSRDLINLIPRMESLVSAIEKETADEGGSSSSAANAKRKPMVMDPQKGARIKKQVADLENFMSGLQRKQHEVEALIKTVQNYKNKPGVKGIIQKVNPLAGKKEAALLNSLTGMLSDLKKAIKNAQDLHVEKYKGY